MGEFRFLVAAIASLVALSGAATAETSKSGVSVRVNGGEAPVFAAGASVEISGDIREGSMSASGVFGAGASVVVSANIEGSLAAAGGEVSFSGSAKRFFAAGGDIAISGSAVEDSAVAGGNIKVTNEARFEKDFAAAGASVDVAGEIQGDANLAGAFVQLNGAVKGDAELSGDTVVIGPDARIDGDLTYYSEQEADIAPTAAISGKVTFKHASEREIRNRRDRGHVLGERSMKARAYGALWSFVALGVSGLLMGLLFPRWFGETAVAGRDSPLASLLLGFATLICGPVAAILLMVVVLGLPLGAFMLALYLGLLALSYIGAGIGVGHLLADRSEDRRMKVLPFFLGLAAVLVLAAAPLIGGLVGFLALSIGLGALVRGLWLTLTAPAA